MFMTRAVVIIAASWLVLCAIMPATNGSLVGGVHTLEGNELAEAEQTLNNSLSKLAAGDGPNYKVSKVKSATRQIVAGSQYKFEVELVDADNKTKDCNVSIWSRPWLPNGIEVTFDCPGEKKVVMHHSA